MKLKTQACPGCGGSGSVPADDVGDVLRTEREGASITRVDLARAMNLSEAYLRDLESGNRRWSNELLASYQEKLKELRDGR